MDHFRFFPDRLRGGSLARGFRDQDLLRDRLVKVLYGEASILYFLAELNEFSNLGKGHEAMKVLIQVTLPIGSLNSGSHKDPGITVVNI